MDFGNYCFHYCNSVNEVTLVSKENFEGTGFVRVTEILSPFSGLDKVPKDILANAANRGTRVHDVCEGIVKGVGE